MARGNTLTVGSDTTNKIFISLMIAGVVAWIVFVAKANHNDVLGDNVLDGTAHTATEKQRGEANLNTVDICFQAVIATAALYFVINHHMKY